MKRLNTKDRIIYFMAAVLFVSGAFFISAKNALAEKSTGCFIILKVDHVDSLKDTGDQRVIMERAMELLRKQLDNLKLKSVELRRKANDIIILSYQGNNDPRQVVQSLQPKDLVVSFTVIGIFKGSEIREVTAR